MSISARVRDRIKTISEGEVFTYLEFADLENTEAVANELSRLRRAGKIAKIGKGKYYVPKTTRFGQVGPSERQILEAYLANSRCYITGQSLFNSLGLTTQIPNEIVITGPQSSRTTKIGSIRIKFKKGNISNFERRDSSLIQVLEALKDIKRIPDSNIAQSLKLLRSKINGLSQSKKGRLVTLSFNYRPSVRALLGAMLQDQQPNLAQKLKRSLNPLTNYKIGVSKEALPNKKEWNIQ